jgi:hypothetical protein
MSIAAAADAEQPQTRNIDARIAGDEVRHAVDVLDAVCGFVHAARLATAAALIRGIRRDRDVTLFGQALGIQARDLFLNRAIRMRYDDRRIFLLRIGICRGVDVGDDIQAIEL